MVEEIVQQIHWTDNAKASFNKIIEYLQEHWSEKEVEKFVLRTQKMLTTLKRHPTMCRLSAKR